MHLGMFFFPLCLFVIFFKRYMPCHSLVVSLEVPLCLFFLGVVSKEVDDGWFVTDDRFFLPSFLSLPEKMHAYSLFFFCNLGPYVFLLLISVLAPFKKAFYIFNLVLKLQFIYFSNLLLIFLFLIFFLVLFIKFY
jgi:hypothetical protein